MTDAQRKKKLLKAAKILKILSHPVRLSILCDLVEKGELGAGQIAIMEKPRASASQVSQYLAEFRRRKLVKTRRDGQQIFYSISSPDVKVILDTLHEIYCKA